MLHILHVRVLQDLLDRDRLTNCLPQKLRKIADQRLNRNRCDAEAYGILGYVAKAEGDQRMAVRYYEDALDRDRSNEEFLSALWELGLELEEPPSPCWFLSK